MLSPVTKNIVTSFYRQAAAFNGKVAFFPRDFFQQNKLKCLAGAKAPAMSRLQAGRKQCLQINQSLKSMVAISWHIIQNLQLKHLQQCFSYSGVSCPESATLSEVFELHGLMLFRREFTYQENNCTYTSSTDWITFHSPQSNLKREKKMYTCTVHHQTYIDVLEECRGAHMSPILLNVESVPHICKPVCLAVTEANTQTALY